MRHWQANGLKPHLVHGFGRLVADIDLATSELVPMPFGSSLFAVLRAP